MELQAIRMVCAHEAPGSEEQPSLQTPSVCTVLFEALSLSALGVLVVEWLAAHPAYAPLAFSHATETRYEPVASLAGPRAVLVYTGVLLVRSHDEGASAPQPVPDLTSYDVPPDEREEFAHLLGAQATVR